jgi:hypothetical protein
MAVAKKIALFVTYQVLKTVGWNSWDMFHLLIAQYDETFLISSISHVYLGFRFTDSDQLLC